MKEMTSLERCMAVLSGNIPDKLPVVPQCFMLAVETAGMKISDVNKNGRKMAEAHFISQEKYGYDGCVIDFDDATIARLQQEVNGMEPALSLEEVLHLPNTEAKSSAAGKKGVGKGKLKHLSLNSEDMNEADGLELGVRAKSPRREKGATFKDKSSSKAAGNAAQESATTVRVTRGRSRNTRKKGGSAGNSSGADTAI